MELEEWEYLSENNLMNLQLSENNSSLVHHEEEDKTDVEVKEEITEIAEESSEEEIQNTENYTKEAEFEEAENLEVETLGSIESNGDGGGIMGLNISNWKSRFRGIGAVRTAGIAAVAALSILILGGCKRNQISKDLQIQIYSDDKRIKQVVQQAAKLQAKKLNKALSAVRASPIRAANISHQNQN